MGTGRLTIVVTKKREAEAWALLWSFGREAKGENWKKEEEEVEKKKPKRRKNTIREKKEKSSTEHWLLLLLLAFFFYFLLDSRHVETPSATAPDLSCCSDPYRATSEKQRK